MVTPSGLQSTRSIVLDVRTIDRPCCACIDRLYDEMYLFFNRPGKRCAWLQTELLLLVTAPLLGPLVVVRACCVISKDELSGRTTRDAHGRLPEQVAYSRVVAFVEAVFESAPQLAAQSLAFHLSRNDNTPFDTALFIASASLSAGALLKGCILFFIYHAELVRILGAGAVAPLDGLLARGGGTRRSAVLDFGDVTLDAREKRVLADALSADALPRLRAIEFDTFAIHDDQESTSLLLNGKSLDDAEAVILAHLLRHGARPALRTLSLFNNRIGDEGACALAAAAAAGAFPQLEEIGLGNNNIGDVGLSALAYAITQDALPAIVSINLGGNPASDTSIQAELKLRARQSSCRSLTSPSARASQASQGYSLRGSQRFSAASMTPPTSPASRPSGMQSPRISQRLSAIL